LEGWGEGIFRSEIRGSLKNIIFGRSGIPARAIPTMGEVNTGFAAWKETMI